MLRTLEKLREEQEISIIVIEHRLERLASISDRLLFMDSGRIVGEGTAGEAQKKYVSAAILAAGREDGREGALPPQNKTPDPLEEKKERTPPSSVNNLSAGYEGKKVLSGVSFSAYPERYLL